MVLGFGVSKKRSIADLRRTYQMSTGTEIEESSFYDRFTPALATVFRRAVGRGLEWLATSPTRSLQGTWSQFADLLLIDATVLRLHELLKGSFGACRTNHARAAAKLHTVFSVCGHSRHQVRLTAERVNDRTPWRRVGLWVRGSLLLFDLGYYAHRLFVQIDPNGGFFVSRVRSNANPLIVSVNRRWRGQSRTVVGRRLQEVLGMLQRDELDVQVEVEFKRRVYRGMKRSDRATFRLIAIRNHDSGTYHCYLTNVGAEQMSATDVAQTYRFRWQIELLLKELRTHYRLGELPSSRKAVVEALIYAALLTLIVSHALLDALRRALPRGRWVPPLRWAAIFAALAPDLLRVLMHTLRLRASPRALWEVLLSEAIDPNLGRPPHAHLPFKPLPT